MSEQDKNFRIAAVLIFLALLACVGALLIAQMTKEQTARTAMEHGYVNDRGEWRKLDK